MDIPDSVVITRDAFYILSGILWALVIYIAYLRTKIRQLKRERDNIIT